MFKKNLLLRAAEHGNLRVAPTADWHFAAGEIVVPVVFSEMADIAREYPLVFLRGKPLVYALTGVEPGTNAYVGKDGRWLASYVPARLRNYPFALTPVPGQAGEFALVVDAEAPQLLSEAGQLLFEDGQPGKLLAQRMQQLKAAQQAEPATLAMVSAIREAGILKERTIRVQRPGQEMDRLGGLEVVDETRLNQLPHEQFARLRDQGALPLVYAHLLSLANLRQGVLAGRYPQLAGKDDASGESLFPGGSIAYGNA